MASASRPSSSRATLPARKQFTPELRMAFLGLIEEGHTQASAAEVCEISSETVRREKKDNPDFALAFRVARSKPTGKIRNALFKKALTGNVPAIKEYREHWTEVDLAEESGPDDEDDIAKEQAAAVARLREQLPDMNATEG